MATSLQTYIEQSNPAYASQKQGIQNQINAIPDQLTGALNSLSEQYNIDKGGLDSAKDQYNYGAQSTAANRGLGWSNIGQNYAANYEKNSYTPAVTQLNRDLNANQESTRQNYNNRKFDLENTLNSLTNDQYKYAQSLYQADLDRQAQLQAQREAASIQAKALSDYYNTQKAAETKTVGRVQRGSNKGNDMNGFYFYDANGKPITANAYVALNSSTITMNDILNDMASAGDANARAVINGTATNHQRSMLGLPALVNKSGGGSFGGVGATR
ncbi:MAG: hypothetical protein ACK5MU_04025 [Candidatus Saccharimonadales bacterium]